MIRAISASSLAAQFSLKDRQIYTLKQMIDAFAQDERHQQRWAEYPDLVMRDLWNDRFGQTPDRSMSLAMQGTILHEIWEGALKGQGVQFPIEETMHPWCCQMLSAYDYLQPEAIAVEAAIFPDPYEAFRWNETYAIGGRVDAIAKINTPLGRLTCVLDLKTKSKEPKAFHAERHAIQLGTYARCNRIVEDHQIELGPGDSRIYSLKPRALESAPEIGCDACNWGAILTVWPEGWQLTVLAVGGVETDRAITGALAMVELQEAKLWDRSTRTKGAYGEDQ